MYLTPKNEDVYDMLMMKDPSLKDVVEMLQKRDNWWSISHCEVMLVVYSTKRGTSMIFFRVFLTFRPI